MKDGTVDNVQYCEDYSMELVVGLLRVSCLTLLEAHESSVISIRCVHDMSAHKALVAPPRALLSSGRNT
jgi:hypothetical protein